METPEQYTGKTKDELIQMLIDVTTLAQQWENAHAHLEEKLKNQIADISTAKGQIERDKRELERKHENLQRLFKDAHERFNSKIMSVYYLVDAVAKTGTHREKETVIMYMRVVLQDLIHKGDPLPLNPDDLPF